jgi:hypothetical protein
MGSVRFATFQTDLGLGSVRRKCEPIPMTRQIFFSMHFLAFYKLGLVSVRFGLRVFEKIDRFGSISKKHEPIPSLV